MVFSGMHRDYTENGKKLATKYWDFLRLTVNVPLEGDQCARFIEKWACSFDVCLKEYSFDRVCELLNFYIEECRQKLAHNEKPYVYNSPDSFIGNLYFIEQRFERVSRPISEEQLIEFLTPLHREQWRCSWDSLVTSVSKSVYALRSFLVGLRNADIDEDLKRKIRSIFGNTRCYIVRHYQTWRLKRLEAVWTATITARFIFSQVRSFLSQLGYGETKTRLFCEKIWWSMDGNKK